MRNQENVWLLLSPHCFDQRPSVLGHRGLLGCRLPVKHSNSTSPDESDGRLSTAARASAILADGRSRSTAPRQFPPPPLTLTTFNPRRKPRSVLFGDKKTRAVMPHLPDHSAFPERDPPSRTGDWEEVLLMPFRTSIAAMLFCHWPNRQFAPDPAMRSSCAWQRPRHCSTDVPSGRWCS